MPLTVMTPRFREALNRLFVSKRGGVQDLQVLDDIFPTISLVDPAQDENHFPRSETMFTFGGGVAAYGAGRWSAFTINNTSTVQNPYLLVLEHLWVVPGAAEIWRGGIVGVPSAQTSNSTIYPLDQRKGNRGVPYVTGGGSDLAVVAVSLGLWTRANAAVTTDLIGIGESWIIGPSDSFQASGATVNSGFEFMAQGYVRPLDLAELA